MSKLIAALGLGLSISFSAQASLIGDSIEAHITADFGGVIDKQFDSPVVVDLNSEFDGRYTDVFDQIWNFSFDFSADQFELRIIGPVDWANVRVNDNLLSIIKFNFSDLDFGSPISGVRLTDYSCVSTNFSCDVRSLIGMDNVNLLSFGDRNIQLGLNGLYYGEKYQFTVDYEHAVPEPMSIALLLAGFLGLGIRRFTSSAK